MLIFFNIFIARLEKLEGNIMSKYIIADFQYLQSLFIFTWDPRTIL